MSRTPEQLTAEVAPLVERGLCGSTPTTSGSTRGVARPGALARLIVQLGEAASRSHAELADLASRPAPRGRRGPAGRGEADESTRSTARSAPVANAAMLIAALIRQSKGDLAWLRPDQWRIQREDAMLR